MRAKPDGLTPVALRAKRPLTAPSRPLSLRILFTVLWQSCPGKWGPQRQGVPTEHQLIGSACRLQGGLNLLLLRGLSGVAELPFLRPYRVSPRTTKGFDPDPYRVSPSTPIVVDLGPL